MLWMLLEWERELGTLEGTQDSAAVHDSTQCTYKPLNTPYSRASIIGKPLF